MSKKEEIEVAEISVICEKRVDNRMNINIAFPKEQPILSIKSSVMMLASGINLLIRSLPNSESGIKEYELIKEVINYMESEFINSNSFNDIMFKNDKFKGKGDE